MNTFIVIFLLSLSANYCMSDSISSAEGLRNLLSIETVLIGDLKRYIEVEKRKIGIMEKYLKTQQNQYKIAKENLESYLGYPVNAFKLIKRLTVDWKDMHLLVSKKVGQEFLANISSYSKLPLDSDLTDISLSLIHLQDIYEIDASSMANGVLNGVKYNSTLNGRDCFELGKRAYAKADYVHALAWLQAAYARINKKPDSFIELQDILDHLVLVAYHSDDLELAVNYTKELLKISLFYQRAPLNLLVFKEKLKISTPNKFSFKNMKSKIFERAKKLCKKQTFSRHKTECRYINNNNPFLLIAPFKMEEAYVQPDILIFHQVLSNEEIEGIKKLSTDLYMNINSKTNDASVMNSPYQKSVSISWFGDDESKLLKKISQRLEDMTGLSLEKSHDFYIINYGVGEFFEHHHDLQQKIMKNKNTRNNLASVLIFLSNVEQGGATIFPLLNVAVMPKKGTAIVWHNVDFGGYGLRETLYAVCPVLVGSKWVGHQLISQAGQKQKCTLYELLYRR